MRSFALTLLCATSLLAQPNLLSNPGFEAGLAGWGAFGNMFAEAANPPQFVPLAGNGLVSTFGNFSGGFNVSGAFQSFPANAGETFELDGAARHFSGDAMVGNGPGNDNWVVFKIAFFDAGGAEIGAGESIALDGTFATDVWHLAPTTRATAPAGTFSVQALILYLQPAFAGGAAHCDEMSFRRVFALSVGQTAPFGDFFATLSGGDAGQIFGRFISVDPANGTAPGAGSFFGLHIDAASLNSQLSLAIAGDPIFGGSLDGNGAATLSLPGATVASLSGITVYFMGLSISGGTNLVATGVQGITFL